MKNIHRLLPFLMMFILVSCESDDEGYAPSLEDGYYYEIHMKNSSLNEVHMFVSSHGETFSADNKLQPGGKRGFKVTVKDPYVETFTVVAGVNQDIIASTTFKLTAIDYYQAVVLDENGEIRHYVGQFSH